MKRLDRYVIKELTVPLVIGTLIFAMLFVANDLIAIYKNYNVDYIPPLAIFQLLIFKFPFWLSLTLPIGTALGASLAVSRLARESELTAMRAAGISVMRVFRPVMFIGLLMALVNFYIVEKVAPPAAKMFRSRMNEINLLAAMPQFRSNVFLNVNQYAACFGSVQRGTHDDILLKDVLLIERPRPREVKIYKADSGVYRDGIWTIKAPTSYWMKGITMIPVESKDKLTIYEPIRIADLFAPPTPEEESAQSLMATIKQNKEAKLPTTNLEIEFHHKFSVPASCLLFAFTSAIFAARFAKAGPFIGVMVSLGIVWLYFNFYIVFGEIIGKNNWLPPVGAAWAPNLLFLLVGLVFVRRLE